jgi:hypothetical protein
MTVLCDAVESEDGIDDAPAAVVETVTDPATSPRTAAATASALRGFQRLIGDPFVTFARDVRALSLIPPTAQAARTEREL